MLRQIETLSHRGGGHVFGDLVADPRYTDDLVPAMAAAHLRHHRHGTFRDRFVLGTETDDAVGAAAGAISARVRDRSYHYAPGGAVGQAVAEAREAARRGGTRTGHGG